MGMDNAVFMENIEWFDESGETLVHRIPESGSGDIKLGAQLTVRESQAAVFFYQGKAVGAFGPGRHTLKTANIPVLTKILSVPWGMNSPLRAEVYMVNMKVFTNLKWGTRDPVAFKDSELGLIRLRAFGVFNVQVMQPVQFINKMVGTQNAYTAEAVDDYINQVLVSRFNDYMGETIDTIMNLPAKYDQLSDGLVERLQGDFAQFGLKLTQLFINSITPPPEVEKAIDDRSRMGVFKDMNKLMQMKSAMAMEEAATAEGSAGQGIGMGMGLMMPAMFAKNFSTVGQEAAKGGQSPQTDCPACEKPIPADSKFCPHCGHHQVVIHQCSSCGENLTADARFCPHCGHQVDEKPQPKICPKCGEQNLPDASFCNHCGEKY